MTLLPEPGAIFDGKYRIERVVGRGAMAVVFEATHLKLDDHVAIKLLLPELAANAELVERFMREGRAATRIRSEHVVRVFDVGVADGHPYLVMEYLDGSDLDQLLAKDGPMPVALAVDYLLQACEAIAEAHARGIVHRDLKPANLFLTRRLDGSACVKVLDFGISKAAPGGIPDTRTTEPAAVMGSPHYMSPEQMLSSTRVDARADIWALGAILHELVVGSPAFTGETIAALSASVLRDAPPSLTALRTDVGSGVEAVVLRCLEKEPSRRYANVAELAFALAPFGSPAAHVSAERIARVLEAGTGQLAMPSVRPPEVRSIPRAASLLADTAPPSSGPRQPRPRGRVLGYVLAATALLAIGGSIARMVVRD
jgi:serine/threonine protein kinase